METPLYFTGTKSCSTGVMKVSIIYEDPSISTDVQAEQFARHLADSLGCSCDLSDATWRSDLFENEDAAAAATLAAMDADYVIVSLLKGETLPAAALNWIETWLDDAGQRDAGLIVLTDASHCGCWGVESTRHYLRCVCSAKGVAFFSHAGMPASGGGTADNRAGEEAFELLPSASW